VRLGNLGSRAGMGGFGNSRWYFRARIWEFALAR